MRKTKRSRPAHALTFVDVVVLLVVLVLMMGVLVPMIVKADEAKNRKICASNLRQIGQLLLLYANENNVAFPRGKYDADHADKLTAYAGPEVENPFGEEGPVNDVTVPLYLLLRTQALGSKVFVCPDTQDKPSESDVHKTSNFADSTNLSYSIINAYPDKAAVDAGYRYENRIDASFAVAADKNPGGDAAKAAKEWTNEQLKKANSPNHNGDGQNVLYGDGHVAFEVTPLCGENNDNIYSRGEGAEGDPIIGSPMNATDSVLLPTVDMGKEKKAE